jgi:hypothetical protein
MDKKMRIIVQVIKFLFVLILGVSLSYLLTSCKNESIVEPGEIGVDVLTELPVVKITANNYDELSFQASFGSLEIHNRFTKAYRNTYTSSLKESIIGYILIDIKKNGGNAEEFTKCFNAVGEFKDNTCLPCLAESAKYQGKEVWIMVFNWGVEASDLGHIAYCAVEKSSQTILYWKNCR